MDATYDLGEPQFESDKVSVRASEDTLNNVSYVKALIDVTGVNSDFEIDAPLAAYDKNGEKLDVDIIPSTMKAQGKRYTAEKKCADPRREGRQHGK